MAASTFELDSWGLLVKNGLAIDEEIGARRKLNTALTVNRGYRGMKASISGSKLYLHE